MDPKWIRADRRAADACYRKLEWPIQAMAKTLDRIVREEAPDSKVGIKWAVPFYFREAGPLAYVSAAKRHVTFGVARGAELKDSTRLASNVVRRWIREAVALPPEE